MLFQRLRLKHAFVTLAAAAAAIGCSKKDLAGLPGLDGLYKTVSSGCLAASDPLTGADHHNLQLTLNSDGTYSTTDYWYSGTCSTPNAQIIYFQTGTFVVGSATTGGTAITYTVATANLMPYNTTVQGAINTGCGGTSPFNSGTNTSYNGHQQNMLVMSCFTATMPTSGGHIYNIFDLDLTMGLSIGVPYAGAPGVYSLGTVAASPTIYMQ